MLQLENLTTGYRTRRGEIVIQSDLNDSLKCGQFTCLLGPNGAGKSTLLRTLAGFLPPLRGSVKVDKLDITILTPLELSRKIAVVLTERAAVDSMKVEELVALGRSPYSGFWGRISAHDEAMIEKAMADTGTLELRDRLVNTLSDGEYQKVTIARALAQETPVILLDEPTAFLDFPNKAGMMRMLRNLAHEQEKIVFLSTHDLNMALALADRVWLADRRKGIVMGSPRELADTGELQSYFCGDGLGFEPEKLAFSVMPD